MTIIIIFCIVIKILPFTGDVLRPKLPNRIFQDLFLECVTLPFGRSLAMYYVPIVKPVTLHTETELHSNIKMKETESRYTKHTLLKKQQLNTNGGMGDCMISLVYSDTGQWLPTLYR
jgi:hypothetical protein